MSGAQDGVGGGEWLERVESAESPATASRRSGRYDHGVRRRAKRTGREKGCWLYIPAEQLDKTGHGTSTEPPFYRVWGAARGRLTIQLYREG